MLNYWEAQMITLNNVSVKYGANSIYDKFFYEFPSGVNVIIGRSGCGKTTLINVVASLVEYSGSCQVQGEVAVVFQQPYLAPISVKDNIDLVLPQKYDSAQLDEVLELAQIAHKKNDNVTKLSGGEQQRVALARAFAANRPILLLDEPFEGLDYGTKKQLQTVLGQMLHHSENQFGERCALLVTHDIDEALALADRIYLLHGKPCALDLVASLDTPRDKRNEFVTETLRLKTELQRLLQSEVSC